MAATIKLGSVGADVETWQGLLTSAGYAVQASGVFNEATRQQTVAWQKAKGLAADGIVGPASWGAMTGKAAAGITDKHAQFGRDAILAAWEGVTTGNKWGIDPKPNLAALQIAGAQANLESNYGLAQYVNKTIPEGQPGHSSGVINNWGAVQGQPGFLASDTHADGSPYTAHYKIYATPAEGAADMIRHMTVLRPTSWKHMLEGDIDAWSQSMRAKDPLSGQGLYFEQSSEGRAQGIEKRVANIAFTLNEPIAAKRGGPVAPGEVVQPGGPDESGAPVTTARKVIISGGVLAALYAAWKIYLGWPR